MALPTAGMWELVTPPIILAIPVSLALRQLLAQPLALGGELGLDLRRRDALHLRAAILHRRAAGNRHLRHVVNVGAGTQHAEKVLLQHELLELAGDAILVAIRSLVL